ncbi:MAG: carbon-nitrogen hydrolase family protein [Candidatus Bathyarchaeia archaeon]
MERKICVAGVQMSCEIGDKEANVQKALGLIDEAAKKGAQIILLQELFNTDYISFTRRDTKVFDYAETIPGPTTNKIAEKARKHRLFIIAPIFERTAVQGVYYNSAPLIGPGGEVVGVYHKTHIPAVVGEWRGLEKLYFKPGYELPVFETKIGRLGIAICHDRNFPEVFRVFTLEGAQIIFNPSAIQYRSPFNPSYQTWESVARTRARDYGVFIVAVNRVGKEDGREHFGCSLIVSPSGEVLAKAGEREDEVVSATIDLGQIDAVRSETGFLRDLRPEIYGRITRP